MKRLIYIILNYKTYQDTIKVSEEIYPFLEEKDSILIVDNYSPNESSKELHRVFDENEKVEVIDSPENGGYAKGNNFGLRYVQKYYPEYVCIINNDVHFTKETISKLIEIYPKLEKPALISPIQKLPDGSKLVFAEFRVPNIIYDLRMNSILFPPKRHVYTSNTSLPNVQKVGYIPGAFLFTNYEVFRNIGFFYDKTFLFCEERFTGKMVEKVGLNNYIILDLSYIHEHSKTIKNEASERKQRELIHEGRKLYYSHFSRFPAINNFILSISFYIHECESIFIKLIRR